MLQSSLSFLSADFFLLLQLSHLLQMFQIQQAVLYLLLSAALLQRQQKPLMLFRNLCFLCNCCYYFCLVHGYFLLYCTWYNIFFLRFLPLRSQEFTLMYCYTGFISLCQDFSAFLHVFTWSADCFPSSPAVRHRISAETAAGADCRQLWQTK